MRHHHSDERHRSQPAAYAMKYRLADKKQQTGEGGGNQDKTGVIGEVGHGDEGSTIDRRGNLPKVGAGSEQELQHAPKQADRGGRDHGIPAECSQSESRKRAEKHPDGNPPPIKFHLESPIGVGLEIRGKDQQENQGKQAHLQAVCPLEDNRAQKQTLYGCKQEE